MGKVYWYSVNNFQLMIIDSYKFYKKFYHAFKLGKLYYLFHVHLAQVKIKLAQMKYILA